MMIYYKIKKMCSSLVATPKPPHIYDNFLGYVEPLPFPYKCGFSDFPPGDPTAFANSPFENTMKWVSNQTNHLKNIQMVSSTEEFKGDYPTTSYVPNGCGKLLPPWYHLCTEK